MEKDQKIINKFLELFPDELADRVFNMLQSNWIQDNDNEWVENYLHHIKRFGPSFDNKILESSHSNFYESMNTLKHFMWKSFSRLNPKSNQIVLYPDVKQNNPELYKKSVNKLRDLLEDTEGKYNIFRKSIEIYQLESTAEKVKRVDDKELEISEIDIREENSGDKVTTITEEGIGYLIFHGEKIPIGETFTSKFKLTETLCGMGLGKGKTIDAVFDYIKVKKDKNKIDNRLENPYLAKNRKLEIINVQMREVNRAITEYVKKGKLKKFKSRLKIKLDKNTHAIWIENKVGRRG